jgi:transcriptional regulator
LKLTEIKKDRILTLRKKGLSLRKTALKCKVHHSTVSDIEKGLTWNPKRKKLAKEIQRIAVSGENNHWAKLIERRVKAIRKDLKFGFTQNAIAKKYKVTSQLISLINLNKIWRHL